MFGFLYFSGFLWSRKLTFINIEWTLILQFCFLVLLKFEEKNLEIHRHSRLSIILIFKKLNSIETLVKDIPEIKLSHWSLLSKTSHMITQTLIALTRFVFYSNNCLDPFRILSYRESTVAAPISSLARYI